MVKEKKKVLLIDPPGKFPQVLNMGLGWLAANIVDATEKVRVIGFANIHCNIEKADEILHKNILAYCPDIVGFNIHCNTYQTVLHMVENLRRYFKGIVVIGGPHVMYEKKLILEKSPSTDIVVIGEAEATFAQVCKRPYGEYDDIEGIIFRKNSNIIENPIKPWRKEFGTLRHPDYRQFGINRIYCPYPISTSRGCPFNCCFCNPFMGGRLWRPRPLEDVFDELNFAKRIFRIREFIIIEPVFNFKPDRVVNFCEGLIRRKNKLPWYVSSGLRADFVTPETVKMMKKAGCTHIKIGVETLVPEIFKHINKGETIDDIKKAVKIIKSQKMPLSGSFIIGLPYDTLETVRLNYRLSAQLGFDSTEWSMLFPYVGTKAYEWFEKNGTIYHSIETAHQSHLDLDEKGIVNVACDTPEFTKEERIRAFWEINTKSGNYVFFMKEPARQKAKAILKAIFKYDLFRIIWHIIYLFKLFRKKITSMKKSGERVEFDDSAFDIRN